MSSHSRNSRKTTRAVQLTVAAALLAGSTAFAADVQPRNFELTAFGNTVAGSSLVHGDYNIAIEQLAIDARSLEKDSVATNSCVAYTVTHRLDAARKACDQAVSDAQLQLATLSATLTWARPEYREYLAVAYSNRAVLNWLTNNSAAAQADLKKAELVSPKAEFVARNLTALQSHNAVAQLTVAPKS